MDTVRINYSRGYVVVDLNKTDHCKSWIALPAEDLWSEALRGVLYIAALFYLFIGIAIASDVFMCSIEVITSKKRKVIRWDEERQEKVEREVLLWNETVANLTLMALGSSAPEILLATGEMVGDINARDPKDALGTFTIIGSAAFNLLIISAVCVISVPTGEIKFIKELSVFIVTSIWSIWAYVWMLLVVKYITPEQIDPWEAWLTLGYMPLFVFMSYLTDRGWYCTKRKVEGIQSPAEENEMPVRILTGNQQFGRPGGKELRVLEAEKVRRNSYPSDTYRSRMQLDNFLTAYQNASLRRRKTQTCFFPEKMMQLEQQRALSQPSLSARNSMPRRPSRRESQAFARARTTSTLPPVDPQLLTIRFRHATVSSLMGSRNLGQPVDRGPRMSDVITTVKKISDEIKQGKRPEGDLLGKFTFASDHFAVLESAELLELDVLFHRQLPSTTIMAPLREVTESITNDQFLVSSGVDDGSVDPPPVITGSYTIDYETREGTAKSGTDFRFTQGRLTFSESEYNKVLTIPIIDDVHHEADVDFYVILKHPSAGSGLGDPSIARVTIVDDHEPGEFLFAEPHYQADMNIGWATVRVIREHGFDGKVTLEYSTIDGTAKGGTTLGPGVDYETANGEVVFEHGETFKNIQISINKDAQDGVSADCQAIIMYHHISQVPHRGMVWQHTGDQFALHYISQALHMRPIPQLMPQSPYMIPMCQRGPEVRANDLMERVEEVLEDNMEEKVTWGGQFVQAMTVSADRDEEGNEVRPQWRHYLMHFITFFWKVFCAFIPPTSIGGAWPSFVTSLLFIGLMTAVVEQLGNLLGCVVGLETSVAGITIIALGTSLPDTFASRTAAIQDENADAAIGNITGSNSVNVFLGLGLPWVLKTTHALIYGYTFKVKTDNLAQGVLIFGIAGTICIATLLIRRAVLGGELASRTRVDKLLTTFLMLGLWLGYVVLSSLQAYGHISI